MLELNRVRRERNVIRLLIIDPRRACRSAAVDTHRDGAVRGMLHPLASMAGELDCAVLAVRHHRKGGATDARDAGSGSIACTAAARVEWAAGTDPDDATRFVLAVSKINIAAKPQSLVYRTTKTRSTTRTALMGRREQYHRVRPDRRTAERRGPKRTRRGKGVSARSAPRWPGAHKRREPTGEGRWH